MSLSINNKTIKSLMKDNKEIVKIERVADGKILYELDVSHSYALSVTASNDIISSGDTTTLTATLTNNNVPFTGETLSYQIKHGNTTVIENGSDTTDSNGQISINYTGDGIGDIDVIVSYDDLLEETYTIEDCLFYDDCSTNKSLSYNLTNLNGNITPNFEYISAEHCQHVVVNGVNNLHGYSLILLDTTSNNCVMNFKAKVSSYNSYCYYGDMGLGKWNITNNLAGMHYIRTGNFSPNIVRYSESNSSGNTHKISQDSGQQWMQDTYYYIELKITNGINAEFKVYNENKTTLLYSHTTTMNSNINNGNLCIVTPWQTSQMKFKDVKIKSL